MAPVPPATMSNTLTIDVPCVDSYSVSRPSMFSAATRASRFAGPASGMIAGPTKHGVLDLDDVTGGLDVRV